MAEEFMRAVDDGIRLSKRLYFGKDRAVAPPKPPPPMERSPHLYLPAAPMVYAIIPDPSIVDNPDMPSYQPHVHGRCDPPALIPLQMNSVEVHADCFLDTALVTVMGTWRVHCVMGSKCCDCRIAVPIGEQGSILGVEVTVVRKSYSTKLVPLEEQKDIDKIARVEDSGFLKQNIFTLRIPQVDGGSNLSIKISWTQKLSFFEGQYTLNLPFTFPDYVTPSGKNLTKKEKIEINVNSGTEGEVLCKSTSHPLKQLRRKVGELGFLYDAEVLKWSSNDINFSYTVSSSDISGTLLLQSPSLHDVDQREIFCVYLLPGTQRTKKVFKKDIVFVIDISGSMCGKLLDTVKNTLSAALHKLSTEDSFNIIAFNSEVFQFAISMESATKEAIEKANQWINVNFVPANGTNISRPLNEAIKMLSDSRGSLPMIFLVTDGTVEDERKICGEMQGVLKDDKSRSPRLYTFGIGTFCNHYFLRMLATIGRGQYDAAYDVDLIESRMEKLFSRASSTVLSGIVMDRFEEHDLELEMYPFRIPDLSYESPSIVFGRYKGKFPDSVKVRGISSDSRSYVLDLKLNKGKDIPLDKVSAKPVIDHLTVKSWFAKDEQIEDKIVKFSLQSGVASEFTRMVLQDTSKPKESTEKISKTRDRDCKVEPILSLRNLCVGFGDLTATLNNVPPGSEQVKLPEAAEMFVQAASNCCESVFSRCCCVCCIQCCSAMNDQCVTVLTQACMVLACFGCVELCCGGQNN